MKKILYIALAALMTACGNQNDFPDLGTTPPTPLPPGTTDPGVNYYGEYEGTPAELVGALGTTNLATLDIAPNNAAVVETEFVAYAPLPGYEDFVENYGYDEVTGDTDNRVRKLKITYSDGGVKAQLYSKKDNLKGTYTSSATIIDDDDQSTLAYLEIEGQHVTVKALKKFEYLLTGQGGEGSSFKLYSDKKFILTLQDVSLRNDRGAAINLQKSYNVDEEGEYKGKRAYMVIEGENTLQDSPLSGYAAAIHPNEGVEEDEKGVVFSEGKLLVSGTGKLNVIARGKHGISSDDYVYMHAGPSISITPAEGYDAVNTNDGIIIAGGIHNYAIAGADAKGLNTDSTIIVKGGRLTVIDNSASVASAEAQQTAVNGGRVIIDGGALYAKTAGVGIDADKVFAMNKGIVNIVAGEQTASNWTAESGIALSADEVYMNGGTLAMRGANGIQSDNRITVVGGLIEAYTAGNALLAKQNIAVKGGGIYALSVASDAVVCEGTVAIEGGVVFANAADSRYDGIDCSNNLFDIDGGTLIAVGRQNSQPTADECTQAWVAATAVADGTLNAIFNAENTALAAFKATNTDGKGNKKLLFSAPGLLSADDYKSATGGEAALLGTGVSFHDVYANGITITGATSN